MAHVTLTHNPGDIQNGQTADASDIIQNFQDIVNEVNGNLDATNLANLAVKTAKLAELAVTAAKLATDAVETAKIKDLNITAAKLATDAVETAKIKDANVTISKLGLNAFIKTVLDDEDAATALTTLGFSVFIQTLLNDADAAAVLATLGLTVSDFIKTVLDDADAATALTTLGFSAYVQTLKDAADLAALLTAMGVDLDDIADGATYGKVLLASLSSGKINKIEPGVTFESAVERYLGFSPTSMKEAGDPNTGKMFTVTSNGSWAWNIQLPHGATVTKFRMTVNADATARININLCRADEDDNAETIMAFYSFTGNKETQEDTSISVPVIDTVNYGYYIKMVVTEYTSGNSIFYGARVTYTVSKPLP